MHIVMIVLQAKKMARKWSIIWNFFSVSEDTKYAICTTCQAEVSRGGGITKSYTTTNLVNHLAKHPDVNKQYFERKPAKEAPTLKVTRERKIEQQLSLEETQ